MEVLPLCCHPSSLRRNVSSMVDTVSLRANSSRKRTDFSFPALRSNFFLFFFKPLGHVFPAAQAHQRLPLQCRRQAVAILLFLCQAFHIRPPVFPLHLWIRFSARPGSQTSPV